MLLYDRVYEALHRHKRHYSLSQDEIDVAVPLAEATVYEISSVVPLVSGWERGRDKAIPKRAPGRITWCEWSYDEHNDAAGPVKWRIGALISEINPAERAAFMDRPMSPQLRSRLSWFANLADDDLAYQVSAFKLVESAPADFCDRNGALLKVGIPLVSSPYNVFGFKGSGEYIGRRAMHHADHKYSNLFGLDVLVSTIPEDEDHPLQVYWPPFMVFSLLHCKNIAVNEHHVPEQTQRRVRKAGNPPRVTYKTISIMVPETRRSGGSSGPEGNSKTRFHLCRGHYKNLTHPRYTNPGLYWWPEHWRGDPESGIVITDREIVPKPDEGPPA